MAIYKNKDIEVNVNEKSADVGFIDTNFYTEDKSTSSIRVTIKNNKRAVDLSKTNLTPKLDLFHSDGSIFMDENINVVLPEQGIIQYKISNQVIKHPGKVNAKLFLKNETQSVHVANFNFTIKDSGITEAVSKEITVNIVDDAVRRIIQENAIELLGEGFKDDVSIELKDYVTSNTELFKGPKGDDFDENVFDEKIKPITEKINTLSNTLYENNVITDVEAENIFVDEMNKKLIQLGCTSTKFLNSTGLTAAGQLSTAYDFNILTLHASGYREIANIWGQKSYNMKIEGINPRTILTETTVTSPSIDNYYKVLGGKTGTVGFIRNVTTVIYEKGSIYIATIMKGTTDRFIDLKTAIDQAIKKEKGEEYDLTLVGDDNTSFSIVKHPKVEPYLLTNNKPEILLSNKEAVKQNPASMTKILTAMIMLENIGNINQTIKFKESDFVGGSGISLGVGDVMTFRDALYAMLLSSSNDTAKAVARVVGHNIYFNRNKNNVTT